MVSFPSPTGESHFLIIFIDAEGHELNVSVPYRGITFLNAHYARRCICRRGIVSVPYRGITFLNPTNNVNDRFAKCFRPLPGNHIS